MSNFFQGNIKGFGFRVDKAMEYASLGMGFRVKQLMETTSSGSELSLKTS